MGQHHEFVQSFFDRVWNRLDPGGIDEMMDSAAQVSGLGGHSPMDAAGFHQFHGALSGLLEDIRVNLDHSLEDDDWLYGMCTVTGTGKACGTPVTMTGTVVGRIAHGRIAEGYNHFDFLGLYQQLGLLPLQTFETCLSGKKIGP